MAFILLILCINLIPTQHEQDVMYMSTVSGWKPRAGDIEVLDKYLNKKQNYGPTMRSQTP